MTNPANGKVVGSVPDMDASDTTAAIQAAADAFQTWKHTTAKVLLNLILETVLGGLLKVGTFVQDEIIQSYDFSV